MRILRLPNLRRRRSRGQTMVEFALVAPMFFVLLFSIVEFGRAVYYMQMLSNAAREGARYAIVHGAESREPSGPFPPSYTTQNPTDLYGNRVIEATKSSAIAIIDANSGDFVVDVRWCNEDGDLADCPDTNAAGKGDGHNGRNQTVEVTVTYVFRPVIAGVSGVPTFTLTGDSSLVINN